MVEKGLGRESDEVIVGLTAEGLKRCVENKIWTDWEEIHSSIVIQIDKYEILKTNRWIIEFKILEIQALLEKDVQIKHMEDQADHEYWFRWQWHAAKKSDVQIARIFVWKIDGLLEIRQPFPCSGRPMIR